MGRKLLAMFVAPASRWWRLPRSRNRSECARGILVIHYSWHSVLFGSIGVCRSRSLRFGKRHVGLCSLVNLSTRLNIDLVSKVDLKQFRRISRDVTDCDKGLAAVKKTGSGALPP